MENLNKSKLESNQISHYLQFEIPALPRHQLDVWPQCSCASGQSPGLFRLEFHRSDTASCPGNRIARALLTLPQGFWHDSDDIFGS